MQIHRVRGNDLKDALQRARRSYGESALVISHEVQGDGGVTLAVAQRPPLSNSSGFPIAALAAATERPSRVIGWHWASPPVIMRFAEIVVTRDTDPEAVTRVEAAARQCGKNPIVVQDGHVTVPTGAGLGFEIDHRLLDDVTTHIELHDAG